MASSSESPTGGVEGTEYRAELSSVDADTLSVQILQGLAAVREESRDDIDVRLYDHIDVEAVERLYRVGDADWQFDVEIESRTVTLRGDGTLLVS